MSALTIFSAPRFFTVRNSFSFGTVILLRDPSSIASRNFWLSLSVPPWLDLLLLR